MNDNTLWQDAIQKEMNNISIVFDIQESTVPLVDILRLHTTMIFDLKMDFTRKVRIVADGHKMPKPSISAYAGAVSRDTVHIVFTYAALNDLDMCTTDI